MPKDTYCGACGAPLRGSRQKAGGAFAATADDFLPLSVPEQPRASRSRTLRIASSAAAIGLVLILGLGALAVAMNQLDEPDQVSPTASSLHQYGAQVSTGGGGAVQAVGTVAERARAEATGATFSRAAGRVRAATHVVAVDAPVSVAHSRASGRVRSVMHAVTIDVPVPTAGEQETPATERVAVDVGAKDVAVAASRGQMAIAKAPMTRSHPGDGTGGVMVVPPGDGTGGITFLKAP